METQTTIFEYLSPEFKIKKPIRLIELFAGIGSQAKALENLDANFEHWKVIEFDKHALTSYNAVHETQFQTSDIRNVHAADLGLIERDKYCYILTYSFPCQDLSLAGNQKGMKKDSGTRSGLLWEVERLLDECGEELPHVLIMENVPQVIGVKNISDFQLWRDKLEKLGYSNYVQILNAKDYGIPQNRSRCFMVSLLGEWSYTFPQKQRRDLDLRDLLEKKVDKKYFLSEKKVLALQRQALRLHKPTLLNPEKDAHCKTITASYHHFGQWEQFILIPEKTKKGYALAQDGDGVYINRPHQKRSCVQKQMIPTLKTSSADLGVVVSRNGEQITKHKTIRMLTSRECWRLMGFTDNDYDKAHCVCSETQLYKQAGNSIVVNVLMAIFAQMM